MKLETITLSLPLTRESISALRRLGYRSGQPLISDESIAEGIAEVLRCGLDLEQVTPLARGVIPRPDWKRHSLAI
jgi:hypothetical protein